MSNYTKVQLISWELYTGPVVTARTPTSSGGVTKRGWYAGINAAPSTGAYDARVDVLSQCQDVDARIKFTASAIDKAHALASTDTGTLKVFLAPEFLYRGAGGAYVHDLLNGWAEAPADLGLLANKDYSGKWGGLFGNLKTLVADDKYKDWLFVFGTALSADFSTQQDPVDKKYYIDVSKPATVYNIALSQRGGAGNADACYATRKQYISHIDFLNEYSTYISHIGSQVLPVEERTLIPADVLGVSEGATSFNIANINDGAGKSIAFGVEVCLDHMVSGGIDPKTGRSVNAFGRIKAANQPVKLQLVPSGGMTLVPASISLQAGTDGSTAHSYAFNCDGLNGLTAGNGSHTQVWNGAGGSNKLHEASNGAPDPTSAPKPQVASQVSAVASSVAIGSSTVQSTTLWSNGGSVNGAGTVRVLNPLPL